MRVRLARDTAGEKPTRQADAPHPPGGGLPKGGAHGIQGDFSRLEPVWHGGPACGRVWPAVGEVRPMNCPRCQHENEAGAKFCEECAVPLTRACAKCSRPLSSTAKF